MEEKRCMLCGSEIVPGRVSILRSMMAWAQWPRVTERLVFTPDRDGKARETIIRPGLRSEAFKCGSCGAVAVTGKRWSEP